MNKIIKELISVHKEESILSKKLKKLKEDVRAYMQKNNVSSTNENTDRYQNFNSKIVSPPDRNRGKNIPYRIGSSRQKRGNYKTS